MGRRYQGWVKAHQDQVWTLARYLLRDPAEAEDVAQEAFVKLWKHRDRIEGDKVRAWLMTVTRNACLDRLRRRKQTYSLEEWHQVDESPGPMQGTMQRDLGRALRGAIAALREPYRSLVILRDVHQHSYEEVAAVLELNLSQVRVYLHRARKQLRQELAGVRP